MFLPLLFALSSAPSVAQGSQPSKAHDVPMIIGGGDQPIEEGEGRAVALKLADQLLGEYVDHDQAEAYAAMLRKNAAAGRYDKGTRGDVAKLLTDDLMAVKKDGHLGVDPAVPLAGGAAAAAKLGPPPGMPPLIQSARTIAPGIAYIRFTAFSGRDEEVAAVRKWLADNRNAKALIFDLRNHFGGGIAEQNLIFSYLFAKRTPLVKMAMSRDVYEKKGGLFRPSPTLVWTAEGDKEVGTHSAIPGEDTPLRKAKVYVLISNKTASAAEHFALALKSKRGAILIGETTAGANHFGGPERLSEHFGVRMPVGRTYDIDTGKDWEGTGIAPNVAMDPKEALVIALEKAGMSHEEAVKLNAQEVPAQPVHW
jgi:hypothetical protein